MLSRGSGFEWQVALTYENEIPPPEVLEQWRSDVVSAAKKVGLTVRSSWTETGGPRERGQTPMIPPGDRSACR